MYSSFKTSTINNGFRKWRSDLVGNSAYIPGGYESIATVTASGSVSSLTFNSIPQGYASLQIRGIQYDAGGWSVQVRFNSDSGTNYVDHRMQGDGSSAAASNRTAQTGILCSVSSYVANPYPGASIIDIHDYASTTRNKTVRASFGFDQNGSGIVYVGSGLWLNTSAITSITIFNPVVNFNSLTTFALYGIKGA